MKLIKSNFQNRYCKNQAIFILLFFMIILSCSKEEVATDQKTFLKFYGIGTVSEGCDVIQTLKGEYIIYGNCGSEENKDLFVVKADKFGNEICKTSFGSAKNEKAYSMKYKDGEGYILLGTVDTVISGVTKTNIVLAKYNEEANEISYLNILKSDSSMVGYDFVPLSNGGYVIVGSYINGSNIAGFLIYTDNSGKITEIKTTGLNSVDLRRIISLEDGFIISGTINSGYGVKGQSDMYIAKVKNGIIVNTKNFGGNGADYGVSVSDLKNGNFFMLINEDNNKAVVNKFNITDKGIDTTSGNTYSDNVYKPVCMEAISDNEYAISGNINSSDLFLLRIDNSGKKLSNAKVFTANGTQTCNKIISTIDGNLAILATNSYYTDHSFIALFKIKRNGDF
jgi:hypothetical protein